PTEKRNLLESYINQLRLMSKPTSAIQFRCNTLEAYYLTHRDRWDKLMRDMEAGKIRKLANIKK
ncbi:MAG: hypothetical protein HY072_04535, partial [Deltaproteobacteria bacterium]|nr:hypothetical protein [Deltaproteobacteria bacterium]